MSSNTAITVNCASYTDKTMCGNVKDTSMTPMAICAAPMSTGSSCQCAAGYGGPTANSSACTKADLACGSLGQAACPLSNGKCQWDPKANPPLCKAVAAPTPNCTNITFVSGKTDCAALGGITCVNPTGSGATTCACKYGFTAQSDGSCSSSSASPLAVALIVAFVASVIAVVAASVAIIRRKVMGAAGA